MSQNKYFECLADKCILELSNIPLGDDVDIEPIIQEAQEEFKNKGVLIFNN